MVKRDPSACNQLVDYMAGEMTDVERRRFERHLTTCAACREDAAEWNDVWHRLSEEAPLVEPPADLRDEVLGAAFAGLPLDRRSDTAEAGNRRRRGASENGRRPKTLLRRYLFAAVFVAVFCAGFGLRAWLPVHELPMRQADASSPSQIERVLRLAPVAEAWPDEAGKQAYGVACLIRSGGEQHLVVYVFGTPGTEGSEAYRVWLLQDGTRSSAGAFTVGESGIGLLTVPWPEPSPAFDQIGITLEPNAESSEPTGPKMFGSV